MKGYKSIGFIAIISSLVFLSCKSPNPRDTVTEEWIQLFNGENLDNWIAKFPEQPVGHNYKNTFRVTKGLLQANYTEYDTFQNEFGHLFYDSIFSYYRVRSEYRFVGEQPPGGEEWAYRNNGLMLHCQHPSTMTNLQGFPMSLEFQLLGGNGTDARTNGNLCTPGCDVIIDGELVEEHCISADSKTFHGDQWIIAEAVVLGDSIFHHILNGDTVMTYAKPTIGGWLPEFDTLNFVKGTPLTEGLISIQAESHPIDFKSIAVLNLCGCMDKKAKNYKSYFIKATNSTCIY